MQLTYASFGEFVVRSPKTENRSPKMKNRKPKSEVRTISFSDINRTEKNNRKPNGLDIQKPNSSVFGSVLTNNRTEPAFAHS